MITLKIPNPFKSRIFLIISPSEARLAPLLVLFTAASARAAVVPLHWYRMGEGDPGIQVDSPLTQLRDWTGKANLIPADSRDYQGTLRQQSDLGPDQASVTSSRYLQTSDLPSLYRSPAPFPDIAKFGFEAWIRTNSLSGSRCIACNGTPGVNGWALYLTAGKLSAQIGSETLSADFPIPGYKWTHVALVSAPFYSAVTTTSLLVDGVVVASSLTASVQPPKGNFILAGTPAADFSGSFLGDIDEVRYFQVPHYFDPNTDLLLRAPRIEVQADTGAYKGRIASGQTLRIQTSGAGPALLGSFSISDAPLPRPKELLKISEIALSGPDASRFGTSESSRGLNSASFTVSLNTADPGPKSADISITTNDPVDSPFTIHLEVDGVAAPPVPDSAETPSSTVAR